MLDQSQGQDGLLGAGNDPMVALALLSSGSGEQNPFLAALSGILKHKAQQEEEQRRQMFEQQRIEIARQQLGISTQQNAREQSRFDIEKQNQQRVLDAGKNIEGLIGDTPSMINNWSGTGFLGGNLPQNEFNSRFAAELAHAGDTQGALSAMPKPQAPSYGQPISAVDSEGKPTYFMTDNSGNIKQIPGLSPQQTTRTATPLQIEIAKKDAAELSRSRESVAAALAMRNSLDSFEETIKTVPTELQGKIAGQFAPYISGNAQKADAYAKQVALLAKTLLGMPSNTFSEADREFLVDATVGLTKDPKANKHVIEKLRGLLGQSVRYNQKLEEKIAKQGNLSGTTSDFYNDEYSDESSDGSVSSPQQQSQGNDAQISSAIQQNLNKPSMSSDEAARTSFVGGVERLTHGAMRPVLESDFAESMFPGIREKSKAYSQQRTKDMDAAFEAHPWRSGTLSALGTVGSAIPLLAIPGVGKQALTRAVTSGAAQGGLLGAGIDPGEEGSRAFNAVEGGLLGAAFPMAFAGANKFGNLINKPMSYVASKVMGGIDNESALAAKAAGDRLGVNLTPAEASGSPIVGAAQGKLGASKEGALNLQQFSKLRAAQEKTAITGLLDDISKDASPAAGEVRQAAKSLVTKEETALQNSAKPIYDRAYKNIVPDEEAKALFDDGVIARSMTRVSKDPIYSAELKSVSPNSIKFLDLVKRDIDDEIGTAMRQGRKNEARLLMQSKEKLLSTMDAASSDYKAARNIYSEGSKPLTQLKESNLGKIAEMDDRQLKNISSVIFDPAQTDIKVLRNLRDQISKANPDAWRKIVRNRMEYLLDKTDGAGSAFFNKILKSDRSFNQFFVAVEKIPGAQQKLSDMREVFKNLINPVTSRAASKLSSTFMNTPRSGVIATLKEYASGTILGKYDKAAIDLITSNKWDKELLKIKSVKNPAERGQLYANLLAKISTVGAVDITNDVLNEDS